MSDKLALVVDDSKMARVVLSKMLKEQQIDVDQVESGEEALGYLCNHRPDMIFMDHTMPGMDGFQTLRAIRNDPQNAHIPIMMYTSKEGEVFVSQARALGAAAIIPKKRLRAEQLVSVLEGQNLLPGQTSNAANENAPPPPVRAMAKEEDIVDLMDDDLQEVTKAVEQSIRRRPGGTPLRRLLVDFREQIAQDRHRDLDGAMMRLEEKLLHLDARLDQMQAEQQLVNTGRRRAAPGWTSMMIVFLTGMVLWLGLAYWKKDTQVAVKEVQKSQLEEVISHKEASAESDASQLEQELKNLSFANQKATGQLYEMLGGLLSKHSTFAWNEVPFNDSLSGTLEDVANQLDTLGFRGVITLRSHLGRFCLKPIGPDALPTFPRAATPVTACQINDLSAGEAEERGLAQSMGFSNTLASIEARFGEHVQIAMETAGTEEPIKDYPDSTEGVSAGDWNTIAAENQRLDITITPL